ncbi:MAG: hypothetical protein ACYC7D_12000 [Nitrososphaerales archaeon]
MNEYAAALIQQAETEERNKEYAFAIEKYLKTVDVLLVMADSTPNYNSWVQCIAKVQNFQKKIKALIALAALQRDNERTVGHVQTHPPHILNAQSQTTNPSVPKP